MKFTLLCGSFAATSRTQAIAAYLQTLLDDHQVDLPELAALPFYTQALDADKPGDIRALIDHIESSDGLIVITPEYNHSVPAVLKNAIDWASRPAFISPLKGKPVTFVTHSPGPVGGARAQAHLKQIFDSTLSRIHPSVEMLIGQSDAVFNDAGELHDPQAQKRLKRHLDDFLGFVSQQ